MGDVEDRQSEFALNAPQFDPQLVAQPRVEITQRFVEEQQTGIVDECPRQGDALLLSAAERSGDRPPKPLETHQRPGRV